MLHVQSVRVAGAIKKLLASLQLQATRRGSYPEMLTKSTFLSPGNKYFVHMGVTKTFTTEAAKGKSPAQRSCILTHEMDLEHFSQYSQTNCYINRVIQEFESQCGCRGKYRGDKESDIPDCHIHGNRTLDWMHDMEYEECMEKSEY